MNDERGLNIFKTVRRLMECKKVQNFVIVFFGVAAGAGGLFLFLNTVTNPPINTPNVIYAILLLAFGLALLANYESCENEGENE